MFLITTQNGTFVFVGYDEFGDLMWVRPEARTWTPVVFTHREDAGIAAITPFEGL